MRIIAIMFALVACTKGENAGAEEARKQAEAEQKAKGSTQIAQSIRPPVPGHQKVPCDQLVDPAKYQAALNEKDALTVKELKNEPEASASCALVRGGKRPTDTEQKAMIKEKGRLGVLPGDEICEVAAFCWTIEDQERFQRKCKERKQKDDDSMGTYACVQVVATGEDDVNLYRFFDADTKCILQVRGGPSNVDNSSILTCAKTARDTIGPEQIAVKAP
jgi:hypothetical protein